MLLFSFPCLYVALLISLAFSSFLVSLNFIYFLISLSYSLRFFVLFFLYLYVLPVFPLRSALYLSNFLFFMLRLFLCSDECLSHCLFSLLMSLSF
jgi:hypothetical protein